jgi:hypothetical protein
VLGAAPGLVFGHLLGLAPGATTSPTHVGLGLPGTGSLATGGLVLCVVALTTVLVSLRGRRVAAPAPTWACGQLVGPELDWTSAGFTKPVRLVLESVLRPSREVTVTTANGVVREVVHRGDVPQLIEERVYGPAARAALRVAAHARRLQSGNLGAYMLYLLALVVVLLAAVRTGVLG